MAFVLVADSYIKILNISGNSLSLKWDLCKSSQLAFHAIKDLSFEELIFNNHIIIKDFVTRKTIKRASSQEMDERSSTRTKKNIKRVQRVNYFQVKKRSKLTIHNKYIYNFKLENNVPMSLCQLCGYSSKWKWNISRHIEKCHKRENQTNLNDQNDESLVGTL